MWLLYLLKLSFLLDYKLKNFSFQLNYDKGMIKCTCACPLHYTYTSSHFISLTSILTTVFYRTLKSNFSSTNQMENLSMSSCISVYLCAQLFMTIDLVTFHRNYTSAEKKYSSIWIFSILSIILPRFCY